MSKGRPEPLKDNQRWLDVGLSKVGAQVSGRQRQPGGVAANYLGKEANPFPDEFRGLVILIQVREVLESRIVRL